MLGWVIFALSCNVIASDTACTVENRRGDGRTRIYVHCTNITIEGVNSVHGALKSARGRVSGIVLRATDVSVLPYNLLYGHGIDTIACSACSVPEFPFPAMLSLDLDEVIVNESEVGVVRRSSDALPRSVRIENGNRIGRIEAYAFVGYRNLEGVSMKNNRAIGAVDDYAFANNSRLRFVLLSDNNLSSVPKHAFFNLPEVHTIRLNNNSISSLEYGTFNNQSLPKISRIALSDNPFHCNRSLQWLKEYMVAHSQRRVIYPQPKCAKPKPAKFSDFEFYDTPPPPPLPTPFNQAVTFSTTYSKCFVLLVAYVVFCAR